MDNLELDDILDDWFIESLKIYKDLHVYQLEHPTRVMEWTSERTVCVAGYQPTKSEILELCLPLKLFADEKKGPCADRDFKVVHGGFTDRPIHCLRHIPGTRFAVTGDGLTAKLLVWDLGGDDSDVIRRAGSIERRNGAGRGCRIAAGLCPEPSVLHGTLLSDVQLSQLSTGKTLYQLETDFPDALSSLQFVSTSVFLACSSNGNLFVVDTRTSSVPAPAPPPPAGQRRDSISWSMDASADCSGPDVTRCRVARLSSSGEVLVSDLRNVKNEVCRAQLDVQTNGSDLEFVNVLWAPALDDCIAVSGFNGAVQVYDTSSWGVEGKDARPLFEHRGHTPSGTLSIRVSTHLWHPTRPRTLLSAATDGSVHLWDWVDQTAADC
ncbi:WD repeat-containing protein 73 [Lampris incognitus]|uniref:WD repeat-containing protein 73 n=1 Tax=Lampris incognitus TaxID=2546036 RepID=UPI0024B4C179|nr:WD repeat-containing protein 73 [Lampris incognitus]